MQTISLGNRLQAESTHCSSGIADVIETIGAKDFEVRLCAFLNSFCGAEHCAMFQLRQGQLKGSCAASYDGSQTAPSKSAQYVLGRHWLRDPMMSEVVRARVGNDAAIIRFDPRTFLDAGLRNLIYAPAQIRERIVIFSSRPSIHPDVSIMSILRSERHGPFSQQDVGRLATLADVLIAIMTRHAAAMSSHPDPTKALASLDDIELCMAKSELPIPKRERQVCARTLLGMTITGIALDLAIGEETVATYRKRSYQRLGISGRHELLLWYLASWGQWSASRRHIQ